MVDRSQVDSMHTSLLDADYRGYYSTALGLMYLREFDDSSAFEEKLAIANANYDFQRNLDLNVYFLHEMFHYLQATSTSYFLTLNELMWSRTWAIYGFLIAQKHRGYIDRVARPIGRSVHEQLFFGDAYTSIAWGTICGIKRFRELVNGDILGISRDVYVDAIASTFIAWQKDPLVKDYLLKQGYRFNYEQWLSGNLPDFDPDVEPEFVTTSLSLFGRRLRTVDIVENAAVVTSLWPALMNENELSKGIDVIKKYYSGGYYFMVERYAAACPHLSPYVFYTSFLVACDIALNPPSHCEVVMKLGAQLRMEELLPYVRATRVFKYLFESRFAGEPEQLCIVVDRLFNWVSQRAISRAGSLIRVKRRSNWILAEYIKAQQIKRTRPFLFANPRMALFDASLLKEFSTPPIHLMDKTLRFSGKDAERHSKVLHWFVLIIMHNFAWDRERIAWDEFCKDPAFTEACQGIASIYLDTWYRGDRFHVFE